MRWRRYTAIICMMRSWTPSPLSSDMNSEDNNYSGHQSTPEIHHSFLSRHVPTQVSNSRKLCYRHRPDLTRRRMPDSFNFQDVQRVSAAPRKENNENLS